MTIIEKLLAIWTADATATELVPAAFFKAPGNWQGLIKPYVIQYPIAGTCYFVHNNGGARQQIIKWNIYQLSIIADSFSSAEIVAHKIIDVFKGTIDGVRFKLLGPPRFVGQDEVVNAEHLIVEYEITGTLTAN